jgi:hypothetical protein
MGRCPTARLPPASFFPAVPSMAKTPEEDT